MRVQDEAVYLLNNEKYLHLRENTSGVGYATYDKLTLLPLEKGQIPFEHLPPDGKNAIPAARNWFLFELSDDPRRAIQLESVRILDNIPDSGIRKRRIWEDPSIPRDDVRLIDSNYKDLYRVPNGGVIQVDYPDGQSFTTRLEHWDEYHFDVGGLGDMFHICQFAEVMEEIYMSRFYNNCVDEASLTTLCPICLDSFQGAKGVRVRRADPKQKIKDVCTYCQIRYGFDYYVQPDKNAGQYVKRGHFDDESECA